MVVVQTLLVRKCVVDMVPIILNSNAVSVAPSLSISGKCLFSPFRKFHLKSSIYTSLTLSAVLLGCDGLNFSTGSLK